MVPIIINHMEPTIKVRAEYLKKLLESENPDKAELMKYFDLQEDSPFDPELKLKEGVQIIDDEDQISLGAKDYALDFLNNRARKKRKKRFDDFIALNPDSIRIVSEGDSWFQHPLVEDIIDHLLVFYPVFCLSAGGDTLRNMHRNPEFESAVINIRPKFFLLSGGGNDILGDQFYDFLNDYSDDFGPGQNPKRFLNDRFFDEIESLFNIYRDICSSLTLADPEIKIILHGYDNIIPNNPNVPDKWYQRKTKSWLGDPMKRKGIVIQDDKQAVINFILDIFNRQLSKIGEQFERVYHLDLRGTVKNHQWFDEIHPDRNGFQDLALKYRKKIRELLQLHV